MEALACLVVCVRGVRTIYVTGCEDGMDVWKRARAVCLQEGHPPNKMWYGVHSAAQIELKEVWQERLRSDPRLILAVNLEGYEDEVD